MATHSDSITPLRIATPERGSNVSQDTMEILEVTIPYILIKLSRNQQFKYFIKGGRASMAYFNKCVRSYDWDLVMTKKSSILLVDYLKNAFPGIVEVKEYPQEFGALLSKQIAIKGHHINKDPYLIDIVYPQKEYDSVIINRLYYMHFQDYIVDLLTTAKERHHKTFKNVIYQEESVETFNRIKNNYNIHNIDFNQPFNVFKNILVNKFSTLNPDEYKYYYDHESPTQMEFDNNSPNARISFLKFLSIMRKYVQQQSENTDIEKGRAAKAFIDHFKDQYAEVVDQIADSVYDALLTDYYNLIQSYIDFYTGNIAKKFMGSKYNKSMNRLYDVLDISWEALSPHFKLTLMLACDKQGTQSPELLLFNITENCKAVLNCQNKRIVKDTSKCVNPLEHQYTDRFGS